MGVLYLYRWVPIVNANLLPFDGEVWSNIIKGLLFINQYNYTVHLRFVGEITINDLGIEFLVLFAPEEEGLKKSTFYVKFSTPGHEHFRVFRLDDTSCQMSDVLQSFQF